MKIYTRSGDKGETGLLGGARVPKWDPHIEAYGTVDELNSHLGMLRDLAEGIHSELLLDIQSRLFSIGSRLASRSEEEASKFKVPPITGDHVSELERVIDDLEKGLEPMRNFIIPGGHVAVSQAHICRTVCRRAERRVIELQRTDEVPQLIVKYLNRLSDLLFVLSRSLGKNFGVAETPWRSKG